MTSRCVARTHRKCGVTSVVADVAKHALGGERETAVLRQRVAATLDADQVLEQVRARRVGRPLHGFLQDRARVERKVLYDLLQQTKSCAHHSTVTCWRRKTLCHVVLVQTSTHSRCTRTDKQSLLLCIRYLSCVHAVDNTQRVRCARHVIDWCQYVGILTTISTFTRTIHLLREHACKVNSLLRRYVRSCCRACTRDGDSTLR